MSGNKRFQEYTEEEIALKRQKVQNKNTQNSDKSTTKQFSMYLQQKGLNVNFWEISPEELDKKLGTFWFCARQAKPDKDGNEKKYMSQSLKGLRYGINPVLREKKYGHDITSSNAFLGSQDAFKDALKELKSEGYGHIRHHPEITEAGNIFLHPHMLDNLWKNNVNNVKMKRT